MLSSKLLAVLKAKEREKISSIAARDNRRRRRRRHCRHAERLVTEEIEKLEVVLHVMPCA